MRYRHVCLESLGYLLPAETISSEELETRLEPAYQRLRLPAGRLELMTGIQQRRVWRPESLPSTMSIQSARLALEAAELDPQRVGALIHGSVCRDHLEPATACRVHDGLGLPFRCAIHDTSNACLGILSGMLQAANMIELGQIEAAVVVGSESSRPLMDATIRSLNEDTHWTRQSIKLAVASLTIGSASCAVVLTHASISRTRNHLLGGVAAANTRFHELCHSGRDEAVGDGMQPLMTTDSERLMQEGVATGARTFTSLLEELDWTREAIDRSICHQVGMAHRKLMLESLGLPSERDFTTLEWLGNTGSAALPVTLAIALEQAAAGPGDTLALLGIGSGINCVMLGVDWQATRVRGATEGHAAHDAAATPGLTS